MKNTECDKMIFAILQNDDFHEVIEELNQHGFYVTVLHSSGGFLKKPSATIMIGLNHSRLPEALDLLKHYGERTQMRYNPVTPGAGSLYSAPIPPVGIPTHCGGVVLFVLDVAQYQKY